MCNIFISHKQEDEILAKEIVNTLRLHGESSLNIFISEEILASEDWRKVIVDTLSKSNLLILLFNKPGLSWDWPLYETGLFTRLDEVDNNKVICIHAPNSSPPDPIKHLQAIPATRESIKEKFLKVLFGETTWTSTDKPINKTFADDEEALDKAADKICSFFEPQETSTTYVNRYLTLLITEPSKVKKRGLFQ